MTIKKILFFFIILLLILITISIYNFRKFYNIEKIISDLKINNDIDILLEEKPRWQFFPSIQLTLEGKLKNKLENYYSENIKLTFDQPYKLVPTSFVLKSSSFFIQDLQLKFIDIKGNYNLFNKHISFQNIVAKIGEGIIKSNGLIDFSKKKQLQFKGNFNNIYLNQLLRQTSLADWKRIDLKISSDNFFISSKLNESFLNNIEGLIPIKGSMYFVVTEEERFGIAFLKLLIEKLPNYNNLSKSLSQIIEGFGGEPSLIDGNLKINQGIVFTDDLSVNNNSNRINIKGSYNLLQDFFNAKVLFYESNNLIVEALVRGSIEDPSIEILNQKIFTDSKKYNNDLKNVFNDGIQSLIDRLLGTSE